MFAEQAEHKKYHDLALELQGILSFPLVRGLRRALPSPRLDAWKPLGLPLSRVVPLLD